LGEDGLNADGQVVLADLAKFCRANSSTAIVSPVSRSVDPIAMAMAEGRREVWLRLMAHLHIDERVVFNLNEDDTNG
jgi:2-succinyl-5-enolpyruvyl-6-hydroxy-3-cyclohexene-1-carboxylate synthase